MCEVSVVHFAVDEAPGSQVVGSSLDSLLGLSPSFVGYHVS